MNKELNRKYKITCGVLMIATCLLVGGAVFNKTMITGSEWISCISIIGGLYFTANVYEKKKEDQK